MATHFINTDLVKVFKSTEKKGNFMIVLAWGDEVTLVEKKTDYYKIELKNFITKNGSILPATSTGYILKTTSNKSFFDNILESVENKKIMMVSMVDVQQGDGSVIETPGGRVILVDGGDNQMFARYLAARFAGTSSENPKKIDCIVVSHGDADHFAGLPEILKSETNTTPKKRLFIKPDRIYHNGIVKGSSKKNGKNVKDTELLGETSKKDDELFITGLEEDLLEVDDGDMNTPFRNWKKTLKIYKERNKKMRFKRLDSDAKNQFSFLNKEKIKVEVLGPLADKVNGKPALKFLRAPAKSLLLENHKGSYSASHTINGHSVILKLQYGNVRFLFAGDLNEEAEEILVEKKKDEVSVLKSEVLKVPHHGSADFSNKFFEAVNPLVSVVSSGDENARKEYIHPRATLMGVLGKYSRFDRPLVFVTEMVAFFKTEGWSKKVSGGANAKTFFAFSRTSYGIVHFRTDGNKLLIFTHSGQKDLKEAYSFIVANDGTVTRQDVQIA